MPYQSVTLTPGINVEETPVLNSAGWSSSAGIRFFQGMPQKIGGWQHIVNTPINGIGRGMHAWADLSANDYLAVGTATNLQLFTQSTLFDITPIRQTDNASPNFVAISGSHQFTITDTGHGAIQGDIVNINIPVAIGGVLLLGQYPITLIIDANTYQITASVAALSNSSSGALPLFTTTNTFSTVQVTLANHGQTLSSTFNVQVSTTIGGITFLGPYLVSSVIDANNFVIQTGTNASSSTSGYENGGNTQLQYLIHSGSNNTFTSTFIGFGSGTFGSGTYGGSSTGATSITTILRYWSLSNFGQNLVANYNGSPLYIWEPPYSTGNVAIELNGTNFPGAADPPKSVNFHFESTATQQIICLGVNTPSTSNFDPNLVRWCDAGDFTDWTATSTNQAGSFRIPSGSKLVGGIATANFNIIWTDVDMWLMTYIGAEFVWSFTKIADAVDIIGPQAMGVYQNMVMWPSNDGFFMWNGGGVIKIPCPVWDKFWLNLNRQQIYKVNCQVNSWFGDVSWAFQSASGSEVDSRVTYHISENVWSYDDTPTLTARTCWIDDNVFGAPIGADLNSLLQQAETGNDADGTPLPSSITSGWFAISETDYATYIERLIGDLIVTGGTQQVFVTIQTQNWPTGPITTYGPFPWVSGGTGPPFSMVHARGKLARITIASTDLGVFWRLGRIRFLEQPAGRQH